MNRAADRMRLGLRGDLATDLVLFGGYGSAAMVEIMERLGAAGLPVRLILVCGRNEKLAAALNASPAPINRAVRTFSNDIAHLMHLSDFFVGSPAHAVGRIRNLSSDTSDGCLPRRMFACWRVWSGRLPKPASSRCDF